MKPLVFKLISGFYSLRETKFLKNVVLTFKGRNIKNQTAAASKCQRAKQLWGAKTPLSPYYSLLALTWWLRGNRISQPCDVGTLCSAASSLCPSSVPAVLCLSSISFQMSTSLIRLTWENCCLAAAHRLSDRSSTRLVSFFLLPSHLWFQHTWSATHHECHQHHPLHPPHFWNPPGELRRALVCHWGDMTHTVMQHKEISLRCSRATV